MSLNDNPTSEAITPGMAGCWDVIGAGGDASCPELREYVHCRNCPVYSTGGRSLLDRAAPPDYLAEWQNILAASKETEQGERLSLMIFRLGTEWLALDAFVFVAATDELSIHRIPHRSNNILLGIVSVRGEIHICFDLGEMLGTPRDSDGTGNERRSVYARMVVIEHRNRKWVFPADEVHGLRKIGEGELKDPPTTVTASESFSRATFTYHGRYVSIIDHELLFHHLEKKL